MKLYLSSNLVKFGRKLALKLMFKDPILGLKRFLLPVEYIRFAENEYVLNQLNLKSSMQILDLGSPKMTGLFIGTMVNKCFLTDISDYFFKSIRKEIKAIGGRIYIVELQDARNLTYYNDSFDGIYSISVIEHIPGNGDTESIREAARVLKPGGRLCLTVPHDDGGYREEFKNLGDPYAYWVTNSDINKIFYQRIYDRGSLEDRLIKPSGLKLKDLTYFGEVKFAAEKFLLKRPKWQKTFLFPFHYRFAKRYLEMIEVETPSYKKIACLTFEK